VLVGDWTLGFGCMQCTFPFFSNHCDISNIRYEDHQTKGHLFLFGLGRVPPWVHNTSHTNTFLCLPRRIPQPQRVMCVFMQLLSMPPSQSQVKPQQISYSVTIITSLYCQHPHTRSIILLFFFFFMFCSCNRKYLTSRICHCCYISCKYVYTSKNLCKHKQRFSWFWISENWWFLHCLWSGCSIIFSVHDNGHMLLNILRFHHIFFQFGGRQDT